MQQRQLRLGDILDDYCTRERRLTNHVVVAMVGDDVKQTRCTTCDAEHEYKHARVPKQRRKAEPAALYANVAAGAPKRVVHEAGADPVADVAPEVAMKSEETDEVLAPDAMDPSDVAESVDFDEPDFEDSPDVEPERGDDGPVHRTLIRAQLPRVEGQPPAPRQTPDFTIRQPAGRPGRFRPRNQRGGFGQTFQGNRTNGQNDGFGNVRGGGPRPAGNRQPHPSRRPGPQGPHGQPGRKRTK